MRIETMLACSIVAAVTYLAAMAIAAVILALRQGGRREDSVDDHDALAGSRFTAPVSLIVPVTDASGSVSSTIAALASLNYPELEVIVVAEALSGARWESLKADWALEAKEFFYRRTLSTASVKTIYRSARDARVMIVDKSPASRSDALNCGVNLARFRYVSSVDPGVAFDADALLRAMSAPLRDPATVVAASSHVEPIADARPFLAGLQRLAAIRSLMDSRLAWPHIPATMSSQDAVIVWRRDAVVESGGFSVAAADPDLELTIRLQTATTPVAGGGRVVRRAEIFGRIEPRSLREQISRTAHRQLAALQTLRPLIGGSASTRRAGIYFVASELLTPLLQAWVIAGTVLGAVYGWFAWMDVVCAVLVLSFGGAAVSAAALVPRGSVPGAPHERALSRLLLASPLDFLASGTVAAYARSVGVCAFLKAAVIPRASVADIQKR